MKIRYWIILLWGCFWIDPLLAETNASLDLIEYFNSGQINWTQGLVVANGVISDQDDESANMSRQVTEMAFQKAVRNVYDTLLQLRIDGQRRGAALFGGDRNTRSKIEEMVALSKVLNVEREPSGGGTMTVQMSLYGGFAQFVLPPDIRQVQPIMPLNVPVKTENPQTAGPDEFEHKAAAEGYTGLIVDARGTGAKPSMVPSLLDENGTAVFGPAYVSREYAVHYGVCQYVRLTSNAWSTLERVAPRPLVVKGLKSEPQGSCHIVISNTDASKLRGASSHLEFLKQCRVIIVLD